MTRASAPLLLLAAAVSACETTTLPPGTGWGRAPDLSVYSAMIQFRGIAREQEILCAGFSPESTDRHWRRDFAARDEAVTAALVARHGAAAVGAVEAVAVPTQRVACEDLPTGRWRDRYSRLLRLLETRLGLA